MFEAKDSTKIGGQDQGLTFRGQTLSMPRTVIVEVNAKYRGHNFSKLWSPNFRLFLSAKVLKI